MTALRSILLAGLAATTMGGCQAAPDIVADWSMGGCLLSIFNTNAQWAINCNGGDVRRGTWKDEGATLHLTHDESGKAETCAIKREGDKLDLTGNCYLSGSYTKW
ncbi:hypothetical protein [Devosia sp. 66-14]|mgnify:CR=1 FL=1|uniref:hypothetical protein n=1 Tax=Devosia sp. 66-14 TaxID=1895752 RepID=UPI000959EBF9|nr:hypothetical protein [Devosia sp. 66-14]OJX26807.1 MAG: hypothetical protein BGO83_23485 [Devosia sp. 66-14]